MEFQCKISYLLFKFPHSIPKRTWGGGRLLLSPLGVAAECDDDDENGSMSRSSDAKYQSRDSTMFTSVLQSTRL